MLRVAITCEQQNIKFRKVTKEYFCICDKNEWNELIIFAYSVYTYFIQLWTKCTEGGKIRYH